MCAKVFDWVMAPCNRMFFVEVRRPGKSTIKAKVSICLDRLVVAVGEVFLVA